MTNLSQKVSTSKHGELFTSINSFRNFNFNEKFLLDDTRQNLEKKLKKNKRRAF